MERSTIFHGKIHYRWSFSIAMLNYQRVITQQLIEDIQLWLWLQKDWPPKSTHSNLLEHRCVWSLNTLKQKATNSVGGCEILHQTDVFFNPSKIMGCLPPIHWWFGFRVAIHSMNVQAICRSRRDGGKMARRNLPELLFLVDEWKHLMVQRCNPPKKMQKSMDVHGFWFHHILKNQSNEKQKHCFIPYLSWLKHVQAYFLATSNEIHFNSWGWLLSTRLPSGELT